MMATESGLRSSVLMELRYRHIVTFLGPGSVGLLKQCIEVGTVEARPDARLIPRRYYGVWAAIHRASRRASLDPKIQTCHGFRKYFENALDDANIDHERKMIIEGHFAGTRAQHYTDRDIETLREVYRKSYPFIEVEPISHTPAEAGEAMWQNRLVQVETQIARQKILEARLVVMQDELKRLTEIAEKSESNSYG